MCNVTLKDERRVHLGFVSIGNCIQQDRLRWLGHGERMDKESSVKKWREIIVGHRWGGGGD